MLVRPGFFIQPADSNVNLSRIATPPTTRTHRNNLLPALCTSLSPGELAHDINHHRDPTRLRRKVLTSWCSNTPALFLPQGLCTRYSFILQCSSLDLHMAHPFAIYRATSQMPPCHGAHPHPPSSLSANSSRYHLPLLLSPLCCPPPTNHRLSPLLAMHVP